MSYEEYVEQFLLTDGDVARALFEYNDDSLVIYRIMEKTGCTYGDARNYHYGDFIEFLRKTYDMNMKLKEKYGDVIINEELIDMVDDHNRWLNYRLLYGKRIKDIIEDRYMEIDLVDKLLEGGEDE